MRNEYADTFAIRSGTTAGPPTMTPPPLSVVIPTHDTRELTLACVRSLEAAGLPEMEVIVVDDASGDGTAEAMAASHPQVTMLRQETPLRFTRAANLGLAQTRGEILLLLNSDTEVEAHALNPLMDAFRRDPQLGAAGAVLHYPDGSPQWSGGREPSLLWLFGLASGLPALLGRLPRWRRIKPVGAAPGAVDWVTGAAVAIRRAAWEQAGPLDEGYRFYVQDVDLGSRLRKAGWKIEIVPGFRVLHHHGATIGKAEGSAGRQNPELLWSDLVRWGTIHRGEAWADRAAALLRAGAALRVVGRAVAVPFVPADQRAAWRDDSRALLRAARALAQKKSRAAPHRPE
jgi:GT2 family glycosyltransferase